MTGFGQPEEEETVNVREACERLGLSRSTLYEWIRKEKIGASRRPGKDYTIPVSEVDRLLEPSS